jgi:hypothetical protein
MCSAGSGIANLRTLGSMIGELSRVSRMEAAGSMIGEAGRGAKKEATGLSANLRTLGLVIVEVVGGDHSEAAGLSVLSGLTTGEVRVGGDELKTDEPEADELCLLWGLVRPCWCLSCLSFFCLRIIHYKLL